MFSTNFLLYLVIGIYIAKRVYRRKALCCGRHYSTESNMPEKPTSSAENGNVSTSVVEERLVRAEMTEQVH